ncbi:acyl-CoA dehydrogenase family protein [Amycolatopsis sp. lyj-108]|uniref:acyl-CoA dehydrogenase family protein n=1 Tax=Amycolatopsis sp. lyj-108 TaxID=2789286 RepID=UPI00397C53F4
MTELDDRLLALRTHARGWAGDLRAVALRLEREPDRIVESLGLPAMDHVGLFQSPPRFRPAPLVVGSHRFTGDSLLEQVVLVEELACGDLGALMAAPGAPMAGPLVALLGDEQQQESFFGRLASRPTWTFFALTEPGGGSAATSLETRLRRDGDGYLLDGVKKYIGNACRAGVGVVFARSDPGPLGIRAVLVDAEDAGYSPVALPTLGLCAAGLSELTLRSVRLPSERLLGRQLSAVRRGMLGWTRTFDRLRPVVAAMGIGVARAAHDYVRAHRRVLRGDERTRWEELGLRIDAARRLVRHAAVTVDANPAQGHLASAAKVRSTRLAEDVTLAALGFFGPGARLDHPLLDKFARDARGVEFMEGSGDVQKLAVHHQLTRGRTS